MPILAEMSKMCVHFTMALNFFETLLWSLFPINSMEGMTMTLQMKSSFTKKKKWEVGIMTESETGHYVCTSLINLGYHNRMPQTVQLKQKEIISQSEG